MLSTTTSVGARCVTSLLVAGRGLLDELLLSNGLHLGAQVLFANLASRRVDKVRVADLAISVIVDVRHRHRHEEEL